MSSEKQPEDGKRRGRKPASTSQERNKEREAEKQKLRDAAHTISDCIRDLKDAGK